MCIYSYKNKYYSDENYKDGTYFLPSEFKETITKGIEVVLKENPDIKIDAIISAGARQSVVLIDKEKVDYIGLPNIDNRGKIYLDEIKDPEDIYVNTGKWVTEDFPAAKILGYKMVYEEEFKNIETFTSLSEWVGYLFTDKICIEPSQACETQLYNINSHEFSEELSYKYGLENLKFPEILMAGDILGNINEFWSSKHPQLKDALFIVGGADTQVGLEGKNISKNSIALVSGTTTPIVAYSPTPIFDKKERLWIDCDLGASHYLLEVNPGATGLNYQRYKDAFLPDFTYEQLEEEYKKIENVKVTSSLTSLRFTEKLSQKRGGFYTKAPFPDDLTPVDFSWSILGDIACSIYEQLSVLEEVLGKKFKEIYGVGFGFKSPTLCQMISDLCEKDLVLPSNFAHGTSHGLVHLCNKHFGIRNSSEEEDFRYTGNSQSIIHEYYKEWKINRDNL